MRNRLLSILIGLAWLVGIYITLKTMYVELNLHKASYAYLGTAIWMIFLMLFVKNIDRSTKNWIIFLLVPFYLFSIILSLITFYASPTNELDFFSGAIFFLAGSLALGASFFLKVKEKQIEEKLGLIHKILRYVLLLLFVGSFLFPLISRVIYAKHPLKKMTKAEVTKEILLVLPQFNKDLPKMLDDVTKLEVITFEDMNFTYHYKLIDTNETRESILSLKNTINKSACEESLSSMLIQNKVTLIYHYEFNKKDESVEIKIDKCLENE